ncbi:hypothetical protein DHOM_04980 [Dermabacter hominis 1368]|uniref:Uncharacterized protein n=1 Tax=Dermabacter hominis 1368 TaxID=1450519 RepID=A0ABR4SLI2_9MICO|nr:hypothetical protein DHOM_04980 [Dermabacter hominis 1368]
MKVSEYVAEGGRSGVRIGIDNAWEEFLAPFRSLAGSVLMLCLALGVGAVVVWVCVGMFQKLAHMRGEAFNRVIGIVVAMSIAGSLASGVLWASNRFGSQYIPVVEHPGGIDIGKFPEESPSTDSE